MGRHKEYPKPYQLKGKKVYYFKYVDPRTGQRKQKSTGKTRPSEANKMIKDYIDGLQRPDFTETTFREYAQPFFLPGKCPRAERLIDEGKSSGAGHNRNYRHMLTKHVFRDEVFCSLPMNDIRTGDVVDLRNRLKRSGIGDNTQGKCLGAVKSILSEAAFRGDIKANPGAGVGLRKYEKHKKKAFSPEEIQELFAERPGYWGDDLGYTFFATMALTGMRSAEVRALSWDQIDFKERTLVINRAFKLNEVGLPKWNRVQEIPMSDQLIEILRQHPRHFSSDFVFCYPSGNPTGYTFVRKRFVEALSEYNDDREKRDLKRLEGEYNYTPHSFRHSLNTNLLTAGADPVVVQVMLRWSTQMATGIQRNYFDARGPFMRRVAEKIDEIYDFPVDVSNRLGYLDGKSELEESK